MKKSIGGFTIMEIIIAIVVISILAAISILAYREIQKRTYDAAADSALYQAEKAIQGFDVMTITEKYRLLDPNTRDTSINDTLKQLKLYESPYVTAGSIGAPSIPESRKYAKWTTIRVHWCGGSRYILYTAAHRGITISQLLDKLDRCYRPNTATAWVSARAEHPGDPLFKYKEVQLK